LVREEQTKVERESGSEMLTPHNQATIQITGRNSSAIMTSNNIKVKVALCLPLTEHHAMKAYWGVEI